MRAEFGGGVRNAYHRAMTLRPLLLAALLVATPALAQKKSAKDASAAFQLDGLAPSPEATPAPEATPKPDDAAVAAAEADVPLPAPGKFTLDTPIADLIADASAKAVLDRNLPGLSDDANLDKFKGMSLRQFQPMTGGQLTAALLVKVGTELGDPDAAKPTPPPPVPAAKPKKRQDTGR